MCVCVYIPGSAISSANSTVVLAVVDIHTWVSHLLSLLEPSRGGREVTIDPVLLLSAQTYIMNVRYHACIIIPIQSFS